MVHETPLGMIRIVASPAGLQSLSWVDAAAPADTRMPRDTGTRILIDLCRNCLDAYFAKQWDYFRQLRDRIPLDLPGTTFRRRVWATLYALPRMRITYSEVAALIGAPGASRAVGTACGLNPIPILVPCHRVLGAAGLGGYSGGLERKTWLLEHERCTPLSPALAECQQSATPKESAVYQPVLR